MRKEKNANNLPVVLLHISLIIICISGGRMYFHCSLRLSLRSTLFDRSSSKINKLFHFFRIFYQKIVKNFYFCLQKIACCYFHKNNEKFLLAWNVAKLAIRDMFRK